MAMKYTKQDLFGEDWEESPESLAYRYVLDFGDAVYDRMKELDMSYRDVAEKAGLKPSNLSAVVSGNSNPTIKTMERIAMALGCELAAPALVERAAASTIPSFEFYLADLESELAWHGDDSLLATSSSMDSIGETSRRKLTVDDRMVAA